MKIFIELNYREAGSQKREIVHVDRIKYIEDRTFQNFCSVFVESKDNANTLRQLEVTESFENFRNRLDYATEIFKTRRRTFPEILKNVIHYLKEKYAQKLLEEQKTDAVGL